MIKNNILMDDVLFDRYCVVAITSITLMFDKMRSKCPEFITLEDLWFSELLHIVPAPQGGYIGEFRHSMLGLIDTILDGIGVSDLPVEIAFDMELFKRTLKGKIEDEKKLCIF